jgi:hypothetical protein
MNIVIFKNVLIYLFKHELGKNAREILSLGKIRIKKKNDIEIIKMFQNLCGRVSFEMYLRCWQNKKIAPVVHSTQQGLFFTTGAGGVMIFLA